jgi:hypothetical protein
VNRRMKKLLIVIFTVLGSVGFAQRPSLSPNAKISIITCGPGQSEVFLAFGHSAIRVYDPEKGIDFAYNYGVFDFNQPNFYLNYTRGLLLFKLGVYYYSDFLNAYLENGRWVHEQVLDLTESQARAIFKYLEWNALPENQTYRYDYFYNNCSSKVRDVFAEVLGDSIKFDGTHITTHYTIRQLTDLYLKEQPWGDLGIDICLGQPMDKVASPYEYMFLPDFLESGFDHASVRHNDSWIPVVKSKQVFDPPHPELVIKSLIHPWVAFGSFLVFTLGLSAFDIRRKKASWGFDVVLFGVTGLVGCLLLLLWTATDHAAAANNFNILWALPTNLVILALFSSRSRRFLKKYFLVIGIIDAILVCGWFLIPQQLHVFLIPFVVALAIRAFTLHRLL